MRYWLTFSSIFFNILLVQGQLFRYDEQGNFSTSKDPIYKGALAGLIPIEEILVPDKDFKCLVTLGKPVAVIEDHHVAGDDYEFRYNGFSLFFTNVLTGELELSCIELRSGQNAFIDLHDFGKIETSRSIKGQFIQSDLDQIAIPEQGDISIKFYDSEGTHMRYEREGTTIKKIKIYF